MTTGVEDRADADRTTPAPRRVRPTTGLGVWQGLQTRWGAWLLPLVAVAVACLVGLAGAALHNVEHVDVAAAGLALWAFAVASRQVEGSRAVRPSTGRPAQVAALSFAAVAAAATADIFPAAALAPALTGLLVATGVTTALSIAGRFRRRAARAILVGDPVALETQAAIWANRPGVEVVACCPWRPGNGPTDEPDASLAQAVPLLDVDLVIVAPGDCYSGSDLQRLSWELEETNARILVGTLADPCAPHRLATGTLGDMPVLVVAPSRRTWLHQKAKHAGDRVLAALLLVVLAPLIAALAIAVRIETPGRPFFKQARVGRCGRPFVMYKLRTMYVPELFEGDPPRLERTAGNEVLFKMRIDPRVTRVGSFLRRFSLDELPQLLNVVRGEMSIVGPRPALYEETEHYDGRAWRRTAVRPGITGPWQVSGRSDLSWEKSVALDLHYVDNWRFTGDLAIVARTLGAVLGRKGAY